MAFSNRQIFVFHDKNCTLQAQSLRQALMLLGETTELAARPYEDKIYVVVYSSKEGYEEVMLPLCKLNSKYPVLAIGVDSKIAIPQENAVIIVPYDFNVIVQTIKMLTPLTSLPKPPPIQSLLIPSQGCWIVFVIIWFVLTIAPFVINGLRWGDKAATSSDKLCLISESKVMWDKGGISLLNSESPKNTPDYFEFCQLGLGLVMYIVSLFLLLLYLNKYYERYRQLQSIDNLRLFIPTLTDQKQKQIATERLLNFYLEETEKQ